MKKPKTVADAEKTLAVIQDGIAAARDVVADLERKRIGALEAIRKAQAEADALLPQCSMAVVSRYSHAADKLHPVVILRRTPTGMLVVRPVGIADGTEMKFKLSQHSGKFRQVEKASFSSRYRELRDVPDKYMPTN